MATVARIASLLGLAGHLGTLPFYLAGGLVAPPWAVLALLAAWLVLLWLAVRAVRARAAWGLLVPPAAAGLWLGAVAAGEAFLGWQA